MRRANSLTPKDSIGEGCSVKRPRMSRAQAADVRGFALPEDSVEGGSGGILIDPSAAVVQVSGAAGDAAKKELERKVKRIGMTLVQSLHFDDKCTHMVVDLLGKKEKVLCAILAGSWIVTTDFIDKCVQQSRVLNAANFQWSFDIVNSKLGGGGGSVRSKAREAVGSAQLDSAKLKDARDVVDAITRRTACSPVCSGVKLPALLIFQGMVASCLGMSPEKRTGMANVLKAGGARVVTIDPGQRSLSVVPITHLFCDPPSKEYTHERDMVRKLCDSYGCKLVKVDYLIESVLALRALPFNAFAVARP